MVIMHAFKQPLLTKAHILVSKDDGNNIRILFLFEIYPIADVFTSLLLTYYECDPEGDSIVHHTLLLYHCVREGKCMQ